MSIKQTVKTITKALQEHNINHEVSGDEFTFSIAPTCSIYTANCTIEVYRDQVTVNENPVIDVDDMISEVLTWES